MRARGTMMYISLSTSTFCLSMSPEPDGEDFGVRSEAEVRGSDERVTDSDGLRTECRVCPSLRPSPSLYAA